MIVEVKNLMKRYKEVLAVDDVSFSIREGEILGLLGPNRAGKTTIVNVMLSLTRAERGEIVIFGKNFRTGALEIKKDLGVVPQDIAIFEEIVDYYGFSRNTLF